MNRYFECQPEPYESTRVTLSSAIPLPPGEILYEPLETAPKKHNGNVLISIRSEHCEREPFLSAVNALMQSNAAQEISEQEYFEFILHGNHRTP
jgi:hypothetical protein